MEYLLFVTEISKDTGKSLFNSNVYYIPVYMSIIKEIFFNVLYNLKLKMAISHSTY